jgi:predicted metal-dependent phosphoesterase TrpH
MIDKMNSLGFSIDKEEVLLKIKGNIPTRLHLGLHLLEKGIVSSLIDAFRKYLSPGRPAYISHFKYSVKDVIDFIKGAGGLAFLAHPHLLSNKDWLDEFISLGLDGLEINYPGLSEKRKEHYKKKASESGLLYSGGSDAHGSYKEFTEVGGVTIPYEWVEQMKSRLVKAHNSA